MRSRFNPYCLGGGRSCSAPGEEGWGTTFHLNKTHLLGGGMIWRKNPEGRGFGSYFCPEKTKTRLMKNKDFQKKKQIYGLEN